MTASETPDPPKDTAAAVLVRSFDVMTASAAFGLAIATQIFGFWVGLAAGMQPTPGGRPANPLNAQDRSKAAAPPPAGGADVVDETPPQRKPAKNVVPMRRRIVMPDARTVDAPSTLVPKVGTNPILDSVAEAGQPIGTTSVAPDDLKTIAGIGPKLEQALHGVGIRSFAQIAALGADEIAVLDEKFSLEGRIIRDDWRRNATRLASKAVAGSADRLASKRGAPRGTRANG